MVCSAEKKENGRGILISKRARGGRGKRGDAVKRFSGDVDSDPQKEKEGTPR